MKLTRVEQSLWREASEELQHSAEYLEHGNDLVILSQLVRSASESFDHLAALLVERAKVEGKARRAVAP